MKSQASPSLTTTTTPAAPAAKPQPKSSHVLGLPELALIAITFIWGGTFLVVHNAVTASGPLAFVAARFAIAAAICSLICRGQLLKLSKAECVAGVAIGASIFGGYTLQTYGLMFISSSKSAFITAFYVPMVPLIQWLAFRHRPHPAVWLAVVVAFGGLVLLTGTDGLTMGFGKGELITAVGAIAIALEIILVSRVAASLNILRVTIVQLATASLIALLLMPVLGETPPPFSNTFIFSVLALGCASALIQYVMNWAQKRISATKATLIYAGEPVWAGVIGRMAGERLPALAIVGGILIIAAGILSEWRPKKASSSETTLTQ